MHVKFLVPEIDRKKWSEEFKRYVDTRGFTINDLSNISAEPNSAQIINKIKHNGTIPTLDRFLAICRFFVWAPDRFLTPIPKWVECEVDDISCFNIAGKIGVNFKILDKNTIRVNSFNKDNYKATQLQTMIFP